MSTAVDFGDVKIRRIVEQEGPFFNVHDFFPKFTKDMMAANSHWLQPRHQECPAASRINRSRLVGTPSRFTVRQLAHTAESPSPLHRSTVNAVWCCHDSQR